MKNDVPLIKLVHAADKELFPEARAQLEHTYSKHKDLIRTTNELAGGLWDAYRQVRERKAGIHDLAKLQDWDQERVQDLDAVAYHLANSPQDLEAAKNSLFVNTKEHTHHLAYLHNHEPIVRAGGTALNTLSLALAGTGIAVQDLQATTIGLGAAILTAPTYMPSKDSIKNLHDELFLNYRALEHRLNNPREYQNQ